MKQHNTTIELDYPVDLEGVNYTQMVMRRAKGRDLKLARQQANGNDQSVDGYLLANLCDVTPEVIDELDLSDLTKLQKVLRGFLGLSPATKN